jgi:sugar phosphate isomerase/epimerase
MKKLILSYAAGFYGKSFEEFAQFAGESSIKRIHFIPDQFPNLYSSFQESRISDLKNLKSKFDLDISLHNVFYDINPLSLVPSVAEFALQVTKDVALLGQNLGSQSLTIHPGYIYPGWSADPSQRKRFEGEIGEKIRILVDSVGELGLQCRFENGSYCLTSLLSERRTPFHYGVFAEDLRKVVESHTDARVCLDIGKVFASNLTIKEFIEKFQERIKEVQFSDIKSLNSFIEKCKIYGLNAKKIDFVYEGRSLEKLMLSLSDAEINIHELSF